MGKSFSDELLVPEGTAKIVFMEYPDVSGDHNNSGNDNGGTQDGDNSSTKDPLKWDASDLKKMNSYADKAAEWAKKAFDYASKAKKEGYEQIAALFQKTADNEKEHAKMWFKEMNSP